MHPQSSNNHPKLTTKELFLAKRTFGLIDEERERITKKMSSQWSGLRGADREDFEGIDEMKKRLDEITMELESGFFLSPEQELVIHGVAHGKSISESCEAVGVPESKYTLWMENPEFMKAQDRARGVTFQRDVEIEKSVIRKSQLQVFPYESRLRRKRKELEEWLSVIEKNENHYNYILSLQCPKMNDAFDGLEKESQTEWTFINRLLNPPSLRDSSWETPIHYDVEISGKKYKFSSKMFTEAIGIDKDLVDATFSYLCAHLSGQIRFMSFDDLKLVMNAWDKQIPVEIESDDLRKALQQISNMAAAVLWYSKWDVKEISPSSISPLNTASFIEMLLNIGKQRKQNGEWKLDFYAKELDERRICSEFLLSQGYTTWTAARKAGSKSNKSVMDHLRHCLNSAFSESLRNRARGKRKPYSRKASRPKK